jgi:hypothetical protein
VRKQIIAVLQTHIIEAERSARLDQNHITINLQVAIDMWCHGTKQQDAQHLSVQRIISSDVDIYQRNTLGGWKRHV